jgi:hypothetical protein
VHTVAPELGAEVPAGHRVQLCAPVTLPNVPLSHCRHEDRPLAARYVPTAQLVQTVAPTLAEARRMENLPSGQAAQTTLDVVLAKVPLSHARHTDCPSTAA